MDRFDAIRMGLVRRAPGMGSFATDLLGNVVSSAATIAKSLQAQKAAEDAASKAEDAAKKQIKAAQAQTELLKTQQAAKAQAAASPVSGFTKYLPYIAVGVLVVGVGAYFYNRKG